MWRLHQVLLLFLSFCLAQTDPLRSQIVGGHEAVPHSRPYMAALMDPSGKIGCGGFLVAPQWVMTAAHCDGDFQVILGAHNINDREDSQQRFFSVASIPHPEYERRTLSNDIRLLKLNREAIQNEYVRTLSLTTSDRHLPYGTSCTVAGWGMVYPDWSPEVLYETSMNITPCSNKARETSQICAGSPRNSAFEGDSGGPLVCYGVAEGVVSGGNPSPPGYYTRISYYLDWINETMTSWKGE